VRLRGKTSKSAIDGIRIRVAQGEMVRAVICIVRNHYDGHPWLKSILEEVFSGAFPGVYRLRQWHVHQPCHRGVGLRGVARQTEMECAIRIGIAARRVARIPDCKHLLHVSFIALCMDYYPRRLDP